MISPHILARDSEVTSWLDPQMLWSSELGVCEFVLEVLRWGTKGCPLVLQAEPVYALINNMNPEE